ncbi:hypothetical protein D9757_014375 [Collybiopsis confluens]|uniref:TPR-like protein n=1 Tax=Collybiopsis confluens TaxID=2823264 RepID=A0A8H5G5H9_9AGAR|nr:hypothetical protein D9757_014375 [Collybiopsis confluens]
MAQKRTLNWRNFLQSGSTNQNKATSTRGSPTREPSQVLVPVYSGQILAGAHHFNMENPNFTSIQTQYVTVNSRSGSSGAPMGGLENQVLVCPPASLHFTGREDVLAQLSGIFAPPVVTLYGPKQKDLAKFIRSNMKWDGSVILINGESAKDLSKGIAKNFKTPQSSVADTILVIENMESTLKIMDYLPPWFNFPVLITSTQMEITKGEYGRHSFHLPIDIKQAERDQLEDSLKEVLYKKQEIVTLVAAGGTGKTQAVLKFIEKNLSRFTNVWFFDASSEAMLAENFKKLGRALKISEDVATVRRFLTTMMRNWICIFDNADDTELLQVLLGKYLPVGRHGGVIVTSRLRDAMQLASSSHCNVSLGDLDESSAIKLLLNHAREETSEQNLKLAGQIVNALEFQALAVCTAGAYIHAKSTCSLDTYYLCFKEKSRKTLKHKMTGESYPWTVYNAFMLSFEQLGGPAKLLLQVCSCLHPTGIPVEMFQNAFNYGFTEGDFHETEKEVMGRGKMNEIIKCLGTENDLLEIIDELGTFSLVSYNVDHEHPTLSHHAVIHSCAYETIALRDNIVPAVTLLLSSGTPVGHSEHDFALRRRLLIHVSHISMDGLEHLTMKGQDKVAQIFVESGDWTQAERLQKKVLSLQEELLGEHHPDTLTSMNNLASTYQARGKTEQAEQLLETVLSLCGKELLGEHHPDTLTSIGNLVLTYQACGEREQAEMLQEKVLSLWKELIEEHHCDTLTSMNNLAGTYQPRGKTERAEKLEEKVLSLRKELLGEHHPDTWTFMSNLALTYQARGKTEQAEKLQEKVLSLHKELLGEHHPDTLTSMNNLALTYKARAKTDWAEKLQENGLSLCKELLGEHHPDTLTSMNNLALTYKARGKTDQAEKLQEKGLFLCKELLGEHHPDTLTFMSNLASTYQARGKPEQAETLQEKVLSLHKELVGEHHPSTLTSMNNLALTYQTRGKTEQAQQLLETVLSLCKESLGEHHPDTLTSMGNLALTYQACGETEQAEKLQEKVLSLHKEILGEHHPSTLTSMNNLALTYKHRGKTEQAEKLHEKELFLCKELLGEHHPDILISMNNLALTYQARGKTEQAEKLQEKVLSLMKELLGEHHPDTLSSMSNLAFIYQARGKREQAEQLQEKLLGL